uniref:NADH-ubiquinone oxidoreductase chain 6 n=1 Tax=Branchiostoma lanceolatum TaxID=7740 RepID=C6L3A3_BRALA|nr:NADH dehydrogenase subunit 6 [Branchiostoma lanceolatum]
MQLILTFSILLAAMMIIRATSPYYGALATAWLALLTALLLLDLNVIFPAIILMLIYLGGMLVVFIYSTAYSADLMPLPVSMAVTIIMATLGTVLTAMMSTPTIEVACELKPWLLYESQPSYMLFDLYERGASMFIIATIVLTILLFSILELVSHRQTAVKWFIHSTS